MHIKQFFILLFLGLVISGCGNDDTIGTEISESSNVEGNGDSSSNDQELSSEDLMSSEERSSGAGVGLEPESSNDVVSSEAQDTLTRSSSENVLSSVEQVSSSSENVEISSSEEILSSSEAVVSNPDNTAMSDEAFTLVAIPDTQYMLIGFRHTRDHFKQQMAWIVSQKDALNIKFVTHLGDIVENGAYDEEWAFASTEMKVFEDADMPYGLAPGNHDTDDWAGAWAENMDYGSLDQMHNYFTLDRYSIYPWWGGSYPDETIKNSYQFFTGAGMNFIIIHLRHGYGDDVQQWAKSILDTHADKRAIIINHDPYYDKANQLAKEHANVFMLLGGHHCSRESNVTLDNFHGGVYYQLMSDYQGDGPGDGDWCREGDVKYHATANTRYYVFKPHDNKIEAYTYSPIRNEFEEDGNSRFDMDYQMTK